MGIHVKTGGTWHSTDNNSFAYYIVNEASLSWTGYERVTYQTGQSSSTSGYKYYVATATVNCGFKPRIALVNNTSGTTYKQTISYNDNGFVVTFTHDDRNTRTGVYAQISSDPAESKFTISGIAFK